MKLGASLTAVTVIVKVCGADVSTPPLAVPPLSCSVSVIVAVPDGVGRGRVGQRAGRRRPPGPALNSAAFVLLVTLKVSVWPASFAGPALMAVAQPATVCAPGVLERPSGSAPSVKLGASLTALTVIVNVCGAEVSTPPLAVPPLS